MEDHDLTPLRRQVLAIIQGAPRPLKAYDLLALLSQQRGRVTPPTIYRTLRYLIDAGLVHRIESLNAYAVCSHGMTQSDHVFLICEICGDVVEVETDGAWGALEAAAQHQDFLPHQVCVEVKGACRKCLAKKNLQYVGAQSKLGS